MAYHPPMDQMDRFAPLLGFSAVVVVSLAALSVFLLLLLILVPFTLFGIRRQMDRQLEVLSRIERRLDTLCRPQPSPVPAALLATTLPGEEPFAR